MRKWQNVLTNELNSGLWYVGRCSQVPVDEVNRQVEGFSM